MIYNQLDSYKITCMRKYIKRTFFSLILICITHLTFSQAAIFVLIFGDRIASDNLYLSIDGGVNISYINGIDANITKQNFNFGMAMHWRFQERWSLVPEFKGKSGKGVMGIPELLVDHPEITTERIRTTLKINYIELPILFRYKLDDKFFIATGPQISYLNKAEQILRYQTETASKIEVTDDIKQYINPIQFSVPFEFGYIFSNDSGIEIHFKMRLTYDITNTFKKTLPYDSHNTTLQFIVSFPFINVPPENKSK